MTEAGIRQTSQHHGVFSLVGAKIALNVQRFIGWPPRTPIAAVGAWLGGGRPVLVGAWLIAAVSPWQARTASFPRRSPTAVTRGKVAATVEVGVETVLP
ncbi:hypothetical protein NL676_003017 [Syzygium grande]|nr:hypothetical protein NL676_003017 [Syzygium grande]